MRSPAEVAQRSAFAAAWRRDASRAVNRKKAARLLKASPQAEARYVLELRKIMKGINAGLMGALERRADAAAAQPFPHVPHGMEARLFVFVRKHVGDAFDGMVGRLDKNNKEGLALLGIQPAWVPGLAGTISHARDENIKLVQLAAGDYAAQVRALLRDPKNHGLRVEELRDRLAPLLKERGDVSVSRAAFIARDQTLKVNAAITKARQQAAGVSRYTWSTSQDERVRPMHEALEGETFDYDDPPVTNEDGDTNAPGEDWQCRCVAIPVIPGLEEEEPEPEEPDEPEEVPEVPELPEEEPELEEPVEEIPEIPEVPDVPDYPADVPELEEPVDVPEVPAAEDYPDFPAEGTLEARHFAGAGVDPRGSPLSLEEVLGKVDHPGLRTWLEDPNHQVELRIAPRRPPDTPPGTEGTFRRRIGGGPGRIFIDATAPAPTARDLAREWGDTWRVADHAQFSTKTALEKVQDTFIHEFGHHVHLGAHSSKAVDQIVREAYHRLPITGHSYEAILKEHSIVSPAISRYAITNRDEYFAESFNAYMTEPGALRDHDPNGYTMVADVLKLLGIER